MATPPTSPDFVFPAVDAIAAQQMTNTNPNVGQLVSDLRDQEMRNMNDAMIRADSGSGSALTYGMYLSRNKTISDIASDLTQQNLNVDGGMADTIARQGEINEWQAQNKFDTLFFLQVMFIFFCSSIVLLYLRQWMILPGPTAYWIIALLFVVVIGVFVNRAYYTYYKRDKRYWNRRRYTLGDGGIHQGPACDPDAPSKSLADVMSSSYNDLQGYYNAFMTGAEGDPGNTLNTSRNTLNR